MKQNQNKLNEKQYKKKSRGVKPSVYLLSMIVVAILTFGATTLLSDEHSLEEMIPSNSPKESFDSIGEVGGKNLQAIYETILNNYIEDIDEETLVEGALKGMVNAVDDPYSQYLNLEESDVLDETISASFEGIGAEITSLNDQIVIVSPIKGSPAEKEGLKPNDIVLQAGDVSLTGMTTTEAVSLIRGEKGTIIQLEIQRGKQTFTVDIVRDTIPIETVTYELDENNSEIGALHIHSFSKPTYNEIITAVEELRADGAKQFVFDFRGNPGGLLDQALKISNLFLDDGDTIVQTEEKGSAPQPIKANDKEFGTFKITEPVVLLVDEGSASASEIVAGALKESANIPLVGTKTFGKGTVQTIYPLDTNSELKLTVAKWLTPNGNWIHDEGIEPDFEVNLPDYVFLTLIDSSAEYTYGEVSESVLNVEKIMEAIGFTIAADGYYDEDTVRAVETFQVDERLEVTGEVNDETAVALVEKLKEVISENDTQYEKAVEILTTDD